MTRLNKHCIMHTRKKYINLYLTPEGKKYADDYVYIKGVLVDNTESPWKTQLVVLKGFIFRF